MPADWLGVAGRRLTGTATECRTLTQRRLPPQDRGLPVPNDTPQDDLLATMDGLGHIEAPGRASPVEVGYTLTLLAPGPGQTLPPGGGPFLARVQLRARLADLFHWYSEHREDLVLVIDDGRRLPLIITSPDGDAIGQGMLS